MGHALDVSALGFGVARFFLGLGESGSFPAASYLAGLLFLVILAPGLKKVGVPTES